MPARAEAVWVLFELDAALEDFDALIRIVDALHIHTQREAIQELRPQIAFFWIHGADQDETRRVLK